MNHIYLMGFLHGKLEQLDEVLEHLHDRRWQNPTDQRIQLEVDRSTERVLAHKAEVEQQIVEIPLSN
jgi:hypothetical protein